MERTNYTEFDKGLLVAIALGYNTMSKLDSKDSGLHDLAEPYRRNGLFGEAVPASRVIDRRLQALRKLGKLRFNGRYWVRLVDGRPAA